jgi:hypothetical protein
MGTVKKSKISPDEVEEDQMKKQMGTLAVTILLAGLVSSGWSQRVVDRTGAGGYEDISKRQTRNTEREDRKKREAEEAKKKAEEEKRREERRKRYEAESGRKEPAKGMSTTTGSKDMGQGRKGPGRGAPKGGATQPVTAGGSTDPTSQEVNEVILNSVKTRRVDFDANAAKRNPTIILLNKPKFDPSDRVRAGDTGIAQPL